MRSEVWSWQLVSFSECFNSGHVTVSWACTVTFKHLQLTCKSIKLKMHQSILSPAAISFYSLSLCFFLLKVKVVQTFSCFNNSAVKTPKWADLGGTGTEILPILVKTKKKNKLLYHQDHSVFKMCLYHLWYFPAVCLYSPSDLLWLFIHPHTHFF